MRKRESKNHKTSVIFGFLEGSLVVKNSSGVFCKMEMAPVLPIAQGMKQVLLPMISHETLAEVHMWIFRTKSCYRTSLLVGISAKMA
jgi:hypothetical protein